MISSRSCGRTTAKGCCRRLTEAAATGTSRRDRAPATAASAASAARVTGQRPSSWPHAVRAQSRQFAPAARRPSVSSARTRRAPARRARARSAAPSPASAASSAAPRARLDALGRRRAGGRQPHEHAAAVGGVALARREARGREPVDHPHGARVAQPQAAGERVDRCARRPTRAARRAPPAARRSSPPRPRSRRGSGPRARRSSRPPRSCRDPSVPKAYMLATHMIDEDHRDDPWDKAREAQREDVAGIFAPRERRCPECGADQRADGRKCTNCGADLTARYERRRPQHPPPAAVRRHRRGRADRGRRSRSSRACASDASDRAGARGRRAEGARRGRAPRQVRDGEPVVAAGPAAAAGEDVDPAPGAAADRRRGGRSPRTPAPRVPAGTLDGDIKGTRCTLYPATDEPPRRRDRPGHARRALRLRRLHLELEGNDNRTARLRPPVLARDRLRARPLHVVQDRRRAPARAAACWSACRWRSRAGTPQAPASGATSSPASRPRRRASASGAGVCFGPPRPHGPTFFHSDSCFGGTTSQMITPMTLSSRPNARPDPLAVALAARQVRGDDRGQQPGVEEPEGGRAEQREDRSCQVPR